MRYIEVPYNNATLRIRTENIFATVSSTANPKVEIYTNNGTIFHVESPKDIIPEIWEELHE